jgi:S-adenosyl-L-methionine hydrolase (adenosine-forming)
LTKFVPSGVITLTTDFGHKGPFVATMKGVMLTRFPKARLIDLTHETMVYWPAEAGFWLQRSYRYFPQGTVHVAVVDPGVGTTRDIISVMHDGHAFLAPDNGLLAPLVNGSKGAAAHKLDPQTVERFGLDRVSATFHGRDIFAPLAAEIAAGRLKPWEIGPPTNDIVPSWVEEPVAGKDRVSGVVITVDNFGNLITNIDRKLLDHFRRPIVKIGGHTLELRRTYGDVTPGDYLALINSFDVLEIARAEQSAFDGIGVERGAPVVVTESE